MVELGETIGDLRRAIDQAAHGDKEAMQQVLQQCRPFYRALRRYENDQDANGFVDLEILLALSNAPKIFFEQR